MIKHTIVLLVFGLGSATCNLHAMHADRFSVHRPPSRTGELQVRPLQMLDHFDKERHKQKLNEIAIGRDTLRKRDEERERSMECVGILCTGSLVIMMAGLTIIDCVSKKP